MKVLIAVDSSKIAESAFEFYCEHIHKDGNEVFIVHQADQPRLPMAIGSHFPSDQYSKVMIEHNLKLQEIENNYTMKTVKKKMHAKIVVETADDQKPQEAIIATAHKHKVDMIVMGTRGLGTIKRKILGSVSDHVLHHATVPVLICPVQS